MTQRTWPLPDLPSSPSTTPSLSPWCPQREAKEMVEQIVAGSPRTPSGLGRPLLAGTRAAKPMAVPMMLLSLVAQLGAQD